MACLKTFQKKDGTIVPCGKCPKCISRRVSGWSFRLMQEEKASRNAYFITLTYDQTHCPVSRNGFMTLNRSHPQKFFKKLRKALFGNKGGDLKYYLCGEYGGRSWRPHYHAIVFNLDVTKMFSAKDQTLLYYTDYDGMFPVTCYQWEHGFVTVGKVTKESVGYTLKYVTKPRRIPVHINDDRVPEFPLMSKGIGKSYLKQSNLEWHRADLNGRQFIPLEGGLNISMPRYLKKWIYWDLSLEQISEMKQYLQDRLCGKAMQKLRRNRLKKYSYVLKNVNRQLDAANALMHRDAIHNRSKI